MMKMWVALGLMVFGASHLSFAAAKAPLKEDRYKVFLIILENEDASDAMAQPFLSTLAKEGVYYSRYYGVSHPSQPNYFALTSAHTWKANDARYDLEVDHIGDLIEKAGKSWKVYAEDYPGNCFLGMTQGKYARRHVPFLSYRNVQDNPKRCAKVVEAGQLIADVEAKALPDFSLFIPNNDHNGHDTNIATADQYLEAHFGPLLRDSTFTDHLLFIVTFDEDEYLHWNRVYAAIWGNDVNHGTVVTTKYNHYDLLRTIENALGLGTLGRKDEAAHVMTGIFD